MSESLRAIEMIGDLQISVFPNKTLFELNTWADYWKRKIT